jgi:signal transduction histidine kinase
VSPVEHVAAPGEGLAADGLAADVSVAMNLSARHLQAQLAQVNAFSGQAAHQLRTPLTALGLAIEELTMHPETPRQVRVDLVRCRNEVDRLADIISDLLALARRGALPMGQPTSDPAEVVLHATHRWASSARAAGRELRVAGTMPACQVGAPAGPTSQVLDVLIDNALKHGTGDIEVSVDLLADSVRLRVADEGTPHGDLARHASSAGEGLGLALAEKLAVACGGQMVRAQQSTTAFDLLLPRAGSGVGGDLAQEADDLSGEVHRRLA